VVCDGEGKLGFSQRARRLELELIFFLKRQNSKKENEGKKSHFPRFSF